MSGFHALAHCLTGGKAPLGKGLGLGGLGSVGTGWELRWSGARGGGAPPRSPQGSTPRRAQTIGSLCLAAPSPCSAPASAPSPQSCFQFKRLQPAGAAPGGHDRSAKRPCNFRGELTGSNAAPWCPDRRPRDRRRRPDGLARVVGAPPGRPPLCMPSLAHHLLQAAHRHRRTIPPGSLGAIHL